MRGNFAACVSFSLRPENDGQALHVTEGDPGGATAYGVTMATLSGWLHRPALLSDIKALTPETAQPIYKALYWDLIRGDDLPVGVDNMVFDHAIVAGAHRSAIDLQTAIGMAKEATDGCIGPATVAKACGFDQRGLIAALHCQQMEHYQSCANCDRFGAGWLARLARRTAAAFSMLPQTGTHT